MMADTPLDNLHPKRNQAKLTRPSAPSTRIGQVYLHLRQQRMHYLNEAARQLRAEGVPFTPEDLARQPLSTMEGQVVPATDLPFVLAFREERVIEVNYQLLRKGRPTVCVAYSAVPHRDSRSRIVGVIGSVVTQPLEPDWQALAGLAHDLRTPLNALGLLASVMAVPNFTDADWRENLKDLRATIDRALQVGMDLLEWSRASAQRGRAVEPTWIVLEPFLRRLSREQVHAARNKGLTLTVDLTAAAGWEIHTDVVRLGRLLSNLLVNAVRYTPSGSVAFQASWRDEPTGKSLVLSVADTGTGITVAEQESIFNPFERGRAGKEDESEGSGLGLAVVERLVEELDVDLEVHSEYGRGSVFHLVVPWRMLRPFADSNTGKMTATENTGANEKK
jgi:nitrogen-specific signal transduction histidine kinase